MKKYLLTVILALTVLLVGCESGLKIKDQITTVFTTEDRVKFTDEYIPYLKSEAAKHGYIVNEPILNTDVVMEAVVESSTGDTATFRLAVDNGEYVWTEEYTESGEVVEKFSETYTDMATWLFCVTHDIETRWIEGQIYDVMYVADGADHLSGYLFNKSTLKYDDTKKIASVDLWNGTHIWKTAIDYSISGSGDVIGVSEYDENGKQTEYRFKTTWGVNGVTTDTIGVNSYETGIYKVYIPTSFTFDLSIEGAILVYEKAWTENGGYSKSYDLNGELISESTYDGNGNLISTETYRSTKSASKAKQVASPVTTVNNIEEIQKMLTQNVKKGW